MTTNALSHEADIAKVHGVCPTFRSDTEIEATPALGHYNPLQTLLITL
jgi:hypothetical protein